MKPVGTSSSLTSHHLFDYGIVGSGVEHLELGTCFSSNADSGNGSESLYVRRVLCTSCGRDFDLSIVNMRGENGYGPIGCGTSRDADGPHSELYATDAYSSTLSAAVGRRSVVPDRQQQVPASGSRVEVHQTTAAGRLCHQHERYHHHHHHHHATKPSSKPNALLPVCDSMRMAAASSEADKCSCTGNTNTGASAHDNGADVSRDVTNQPISGSDASTSARTGDLARPTQAPFDTSTPMVDFWNEGESIVQKQSVTTTQLREVYDSPSTLSSVKTTSMTSSSGR